MLGLSCDMISMNDLIAGFSECEFDLLGNVFVNIRKKGTARMGYRLEAELCLVLSRTHHVVIMRSVHHRRRDQQVNQFVFYELISKMDQHIMFVPRHLRELAVRQYCAQ